jgi:hypothetical protein
MANREKPICPWNNDFNKRVARHWYTLYGLASSVNMVPDSFGFCACCVANKEPARHTRRRRRCRRRCLARRPLFYLCGLLS